MPIRFGTQADLENIRVIKPVNFYGQLGSGSGETCNCVTSPCHCDDTEPQVVFGNGSFSRTKTVKPIWAIAPPREPIRTGGVDPQIQVACDCMPGHHSVNLPDGGCTCVKNAASATTEPADDGKIFGMPKWLVIGGGVAAGLYLLSQMGEVK